MAGGGLTGFLHHIGTFLLLAATALLIVTDVTAPVVNNLGIMKVDTPFIEGSRMTQISFGTFGYCILDANPDGDDVDICTDKKVGYRPIEPLLEYDETSFSSYADRTTKILSRVMVLHPIATGMAFIAFLLALGSGIVGSLLASLLSGLTFLTTACVLVCDFVLFSIIRSNVNEGDDGNGSHAYYSAGMWTTLASAICSLFATVVVLLSCCSKRLHKKREHEKVHGTTSPPARRRGAGKWMFWRRSRSPAASPAY